MALTKITSNLIGSNAISAGNITDASITADDLHATLDLTGKTVTVATASAGDNDTSVASTAFVKTAIDNIIDGAPAGLNTLNEIAASLNDDTGLNTTLVNSIATKLPLAGGTLTGALTTNGVINTGTSHNFAINTPNSLRINIDSNNSNVGEIFAIGHNQTAVDASNNVLFLIQGSNGRVGIGTTNINANLHVGSASATGSASTPAVQIGGANTYRLGLYTDSEGGIIENKNGDNGLQFRVKTAGEVMRLVSGAATINSDTSINRGNQTAGELLLGGTTDGGFVDFDGTSLQLNTQRDPNTGTFINTSKSHAGITVVGASGDSHIKFYTTDANNTAATERMRIENNGRVGIGLGGVDASQNLHVKGVGVLFDSSTYNILELRTDSNDNGSSDDGIIHITNSSSSTVKAELRWDESENKVHLSYGDHGRSLVIDSSHNVGVGTSNNSLDSRFNIRADNNSAGDLYTGIGPGNAPGMTIQNGGTTDSNHATIFFKNDSGHRAHIGAKFVNHTTEQTNLTFGTTDSSGNARERLHLIANTNNGADFIGHEGPNATSSTAGDNWHLVADRAMEVKQDNNNASSWIAMKTFTLGANCKSLSIKWAARNASGTYYWAWRITRNGTVMNMVNHGGGNAQKSFSYGLASGESASVHAFRSYDVDVGEAFAGDVIQLEMINSTGGGTPVAGTQYLYAKQFLVTSLDKGKIYNGDRGTIRRPMVYGASQFTQTNGNEYDLGSFEFPFRMNSGTHNVLELAEFDIQTTANATMQYVGLYGYAGRAMGQGIAMASTRRRSNNTDWEDIDGATVHSANGANGGITHPDFYWADGVLKVGVSSSLQITGRIKVTWRQATIQRHWDI